MGSILQEAIAAAPTCEARTGYRAGEFAEEPLWCDGQRGLRSLVDADGVTHWYCAAPRHRESVVRQHGPRAELERGTATFDAPGCFFCKRTAPILDGLYTAIDFGGAIGIQHVCDDCNERADDVVGLVLIHDPLEVVRSREEKS